MGLRYGVLIVTYNRLEILKNCLLQIDNQSVKFCSTTIIDNCSTDGTLEFLDNYVLNHENTTVIHLKENLGGAGGFEIGVKNIIKCRENIDYLLFIDDDAILNRDFLKLVDNSVENGVFAYSGSVVWGGNRYIA